MTLRRRLILTLSILIGFLGWVGYLGLKTASSVREDFERVTDQTLPALQALEELRFGVIRAISSAAELAFLHKESEEEQEEEGKRGEVLLLDEGKALGEASLQHYLSLVEEFSPEEKAIADELRTATEAVFQGIDQFVELVGQKAEGPVLLAKKEELEALERSFLSSFEHVLEHERGQMALRRQAVSDRIAAGQRSVGGVAAVGLLVAGAFALGYVLVFSGALAKLLEGAKRFGAGQLEWKIDLEAGHELTTLARGLERMAGDLRRSTVSSSFLEGLLQSMLDGLVVVGPDGSIRMTNQGLLDLLGFEEGDLLGRPCRELFADPRFSSASRLDSLLQAGLIGQNTSTFVARDGAEIPVSLSSSLLLSGDTIEGLVCVAQDLRGRLRLQEEALRQRDLLAGTLASIGDAVIATDVVGKVTFINRVAEEITGWPQAEAEGQDIEEVFRISNEHTGAVTRSPVHRVLEEGITVGLANHTILTARHGGRYPIDDSAAPIRDKDGELRGVILVFRDVSARRAMEEDLLAAKLAAERANQSKSEFLAMMSHEIRTPLNGIIGVSRLLLDTANLPSLEKGYAETIHLSGNTLMALIEEILDFSRIEQGAVVLEQKAFNLLQCIEEAFGVVGPRLLEKDLELNFQVDPDLPAVLVGDANRLRQVLINLISNAI
ncbi:MAG: PAS domain S-box protein, partial [Acidobacteria bacterium]|nr:PAS domain S-box protein [Acidobacteriota bacterium]